MLHNVIATESLPICTPVGRFFNGVDTRTAVQRAGLNDVVRRANGFSKMGEECNGAVSIDPEALGSRKPLGSFDWQAVD